MISFVKGIPAWYRVIERYRDGRSGDFKGMTTFVKCRCHRGATHRSVVCIYTEFVRRGGINALFRKVVIQYDTLSAAKLHSTAYQMGG